MANNITRLNAKSNDGQELDVQHHSTSYTNAAIRRISFANGKDSIWSYKWFMDETSREAAARRCRYVTIIGVNDIFIAKGAENDKNNI